MKDVQILAFSSKVESVFLNIRNQLQLFETTLNRIQNVSNKSPEDPWSEHNSNHRKSLLYSLLSRLQDVYDRDDG
jgi:hypothetical protein